jgi:NADH dehydrogenase/NADH:ubiquinone oxidoreductase subunit G
VVLSSYREPWDKVADVILPMPTAFEKSGTTVCADGHAGQVVAAVDTRVPSLEATTTMLVKAMR